MHNVHPTSKVQPRPEVTPISLPSPGSWWSQPRANPAIPSHLRAATTPAPSAIQQPAKQAPADHALFSLFGGPVGPKSPGIEDPYEEALDDQTDGGDFPSSPAAMFLSGINSPSGSLRSNSMSMSFSSPNRPRIVPPADEIIGGYRLGSVIGQGAFSTVKRATSVSSSPSDGSPSTVAAVKIVLKNDSRPGASEARVRLSKESKIWSQLSHEHILPLFHTIETDDATFLFTLYCPAGTLLDVINSHKMDGLDGVGMDDAGMLFRQVVRGLKYLHEVVRLVHGDIKLENVLVDDQGSCRIADFGLARWMQDPNEEKPSTSASLEPPTHQRENVTLALHDSVRRTRGRHRLPSRLSNSFTDEADTNSASSKPNTQHYFAPGSLPYAAPELLRPSHSSDIPPANPAQDVWALGCVLYALLFGQLPFKDPFEPRLTMKILSGIWRLPSNYRASGPTNSRPGRRSQSGSRTRSGSARGTSRSRTRDRSASRTRTKTSAMLTSPVAARARPRSKSRGRTAPASATPSSQSQLKTIGRVAENVLHGCLCNDLQQRWTISMVDEVGWGVGWDLDVDEAGEEEEDLHELEAGEMTSSSSGSTCASEAVSFHPDTSEDTTRDRLGNRLYIPPSPSTSSDVNNPLFSTTLSLITSPHATSGRRMEPVTEKAEVEHDYVVVESSTAVQPSEDLHDAAESSKEKRSRSRGKRGKTSRSSSRTPAVSSLTPSSPASSISSPSAQDSSDPFQAFREGYIPPSVIPLLASSTPSSRASSRAPSDARSRSASKERGDNHSEWSRGRPTSSSGGSWRIVGSSASRSVGHAPALPTIDSGRSFEEPVGVWRPPREFVSVSPSQSPAPETPIDRDASNRRSRSRGRMGVSHLNTRVALAESSSSVPPSARDFGQHHSRPRRDYHSSQPNLPGAVEKAMNDFMEVERGRRGGSVDYRVNWKGGAD
ncbi:hypothetical protein FRC04_008972 [Tulasnella sp. 424]|nr:hypothetical protein FRC04_008972 [Tulasnella sp. 424]KAG8973628.1 hypothetical protein FRC05_008564 [Tulasnella sp. 425]